MKKALHDLCLITTVFILLTAVSTSFFLWDYVVRMYGPNEYTLAISVGLTLTSIIISSPLIAKTTRRFFGPFQSSHIIEIVIG